MIDAGANKGDWSQKFLLSNTFAYKLLLIIEPQSIHIPSLLKLCDDSSRVVVEQIALGAAPGRLTLYADFPGSGWASLYQRDLGHVDAEMSPQENVEVVTLDQLTKKHLINHIAFLKLDLEGHELEALKGARELLDTKNIDALTFEFGGCNIDSRTYIKDFWSMLVDQHQFVFYRLLPKRRLKRLSKYSECHEQFCWQNILACAPGITPNWKVLD